MANTDKEVELLIKSRLALSKEKSSLNKKIILGYFVAICFLFPLRKVIVFGRLDYLIFPLFCIATFTAVPYIVGIIDHYFTKESGSADWTNAEQELEKSDLSRIELTEIRLFLGKVFSDFELFTRFNKCMVESSDGKDTILPFARELDCYVDFDMIANVDFSVELHKDRSALYTINQEEFRVYDFVPNDM